MSYEPELKLVITRREIEAAVEKLARDITRDFCEKNPLLVGLLTGAFIFMADLVRRLDFPLEIEFMDVSSYGGTESGELRLLKDLTMDITGRDVLMVEEVLDTGRCASFVLEHLAQKASASLKTCFLLDKPGRRRAPVKSDYIGLDAPDRFLVGYGLDWNGRFRNLPDIYALEF